MNEKQLEDSMQMFKEYNRTMQTYNIQVFMLFLSSLGFIEYDVVLLDKVCRLGRRHEDWGV